MTSHRHSQVCLPSSAPFPFRNSSNTGLADYGSVLDASNSGKKTSPALKMPRSSFYDDSGLDSKDPKLFDQNTFTTGLRILTRDLGRWNLVLVEKALRCLVQLPNQCSEFGGDQTETERVWLGSRSNGLPPASLGSH